MHTHQWQLSIRTNTRVEKGVTVMNIMETTIRMMHSIVGEFRAESNWIRIRAESNWIPINFWSSSLPYLVFHIAIRSNSNSVRFHSNSNSVRLHQVIQNLVESVLRKRVIATFFFTFCNLELNYIPLIYAAQMKKVMMDVRRHGTYC